MEPTKSPENKIGGVAYHEAGHAVVHFIFGHDLVSISIVPDIKKGVDGAIAAYGQHPLILSQQGIHFEGPERWRHICHNIMMSLAGPVAQKMFCPESVEDHQDAFDRSLAQRHIKLWGPQAYPHEREKRLDQLEANTWELLKKPSVAAAVHALAKAVLEQQTLTGEQARTVINQAMTESRKEAKSTKITCPHCRDDVDGQAQDAD